MAKSLFSDIMSPVAKTNQDGDLDSNFMLVLDLLSINIIFKSAVSNYILVINRFVLCCMLSHAVLCSLVRASLQISPATLRVWVLLSFL